MGQCLKMAAEALRELWGGRSSALRLRKMLSSSWSWEWPLSCGREERKAAVTGSVFLLCVLLSVEELLGESLGCG